MRELAEDAKGPEFDHLFKHGLDLEADSARRPRLLKVPVCECAINNACGHYLKIGPPDGMVFNLVSYKRCSDSIAKDPRFPSERVMV